MLINFTNHPFEYWSLAQREIATKQFGEVHDEPFPDIDPYATTQEIQQLAALYLKKVNEKYPKGFAVHVMGEFTFCYIFISLCKMQKIHCFASTTKREIVSMKNGEKISKFTFILFREY